MLFRSCGVLSFSDKALPVRLAAIYEAVREQITAHRPGLLAIESVFMSSNPRSALVLGQARGAAICAAVSCGLEVAEYAPTQIKQAVSGRGRADKAQVQHMVTVLLGLGTKPASDAADALACAICHIHQHQGALHLARGMAQA